MDLCFVCSGEPHADTTARGGHKFWATSAALREAAEHDAKTILVETPESRYVRTFRPY